MKHPISISTGSLYRHMQDRDAMIRKLLEFSPDGIEISLADPRLVFGFDINRETLHALWELRNVSIHAPWKDVTYSTEPRSRQLLAHLERIYNLLAARNITFHSENILNYSAFSNYDFNISIENDDWKKPTSTVQSIDALLSQNPRLMFTFDFSHALTVNPAYIPEFISRFKQRISQVNLSYLDRELKDHWFLHKKDSPELRQSLSYLKQLNVPLVLECVAATPEEFPLIKNEIEYLRKL